VRVYPVKTKAATRDDLLRQIARERGISPYVRTVSKAQREQAGIAWGGFVLGTVLRQERETNAVAYSDSNPVVNNKDSLNIASDEGSQEPPVSQQGEGFQQPIGCPAIQEVVVLYIKGNKSFIMELSIRLPEGNSLELTDIQRRWQP
jgi:hypothetical protein